MSVEFLDVKDLVLLSELSQTIQERKKEVDHQKELLHGWADLKQKVRLQKNQIDAQWMTLLEMTKKECEFLAKEREQIDYQIKNENLLGSKESLSKLPGRDISPNNKTSKLPPSRLGNYTIIAKRLQTEIKQLEQNVADMKNRLQSEVQNRSELEAKLRDLRSTLTLHRRTDPSWTCPTTPVGNSTF